MITLIIGPKSSGKTTLALGIIDRLYPGARDVILLDDLVYDYQERAFAHVLFAGQNTIFAKDQVDVARFIEYYTHVFITMTDKVPALLALADGVIQIRNE